MLMGFLVFVLVVFSGSVANAATTHIPCDPDSGWVGGDDSVDGLTGTDFSFPFYGSSYDDFYVTTNGVVSFGGGTGTYTNAHLPAVSYNYPAVFPFWDDLHPTYSDATDGFILYKRIASDEHDNPYDEEVLIVQWTNYGYYASDLVHGTFQVHLVADGRIVFNYNDLVAPERAYGQTATIGIQESGSGPAIELSYNEDAGIRSGTAFMFAWDDDSDAYDYSDAPDASNFWDVLLIKGDTPPPTKPTSPDPAFGETTSETPTLSWEASSGADDYTVLVSTSTSLANPVIDADVTETSFQVTDELSIDTQYYWQVIARNDSGDAPSDRWEFLTADAVETYTVRYLAGDHGSIEGQATQEVEAGADAATVSAVADSGYRFDEWSDGITTAERTDLSIDADMEVTAGFKKRPIIYRIRASAEPSDGGIIHGTGTRRKDRQVELEAVPADGYRFVQWLDGGDVLGTDRVLAFQATGNRRLTAVFEEEGEAESEDAVESASPRGYIGGYPDGRFHPERPLNRAELAVILGRLDGDEIPSDGERPEIPDVPGDHWAYDAMVRAMQRELLQGFADGHLRPHEPLTRAQMAAVLVRWMGLEESDDPVEFTDMEGHWAGDVASRVHAAGFMAAFSDGTFRPEDPISRAETVMLLNRVLGLEERADVVMPWSDLDPTHPAYGAVGAAWMQLNDD
ncbi:MAG: S-layer homology domain-containing protein [Bacillota bacterium]